MSLSCFEHPKIDQVALDLFFWARLGVLFGVVEQNCDHLTILVGFGNHVFVTIFVTQENLVTDCRDFLFFKLKSLDVHMV